MWTIVILAFHPSVGIQYVHMLYTCCVFGDVYRWLWALLAKTHRFSDSFGRLNVRTTIPAAVGIIKVMIWLPLDTVILQFA